MANLLVLPLGVISEAELPVGHPGLSFGLALLIVGAIGVVIKRMLLDSFANRVEVQLTERAILSAATEDEMFAHGIIAYWAIRDSAPPLARKFRLIFPDSGVNSVGSTMLEPIRQALQDLHRTRSTARQFAEDGRDADWARKDLFAKKLMHAAKYIRNEREDNQVKNPRFETAWFRIVKVPAWLAQASFNFGVAITIVLLIVIFF